MQNAINWFEIPATDINRAVQFYNRILDTSLRLESFGGVPNAFFPNEGGVGGAVVSGEGYAPNMTGSVVYLNADGKLDAILSRVEGAGGSVVLPRTSIGEFGWIALLLDTEGNKIGLHDEPEA